MSRHEIIGAIIAAGGILAAVALLFLLIFALTGCGTARDSQTRTVERLQTSTGPVVIDTPIGGFTVQPVRHEMVRSETEVSTEQTRIDAPEVGALVGTAGIASPLGAIAGIGGLLAAAFAGKKALDFRRHRDQVIDSVEAGREHLPEDLDKQFCMALASKQDNDLQSIIQKRN